MPIILATFSLLAAAQGAPLGAVPPPVEQATANCANPVYASDQLVCSDRELKGRDAQLAALVGQAPIAGAVLMESDSAWFSRRSRCAFSSDHRACLAAAYGERIALHEALAASLSPEGETFVKTCRSRDQNLDVRFSTSGTAPTTVLSDAASGKVLGVLFGQVSSEAPWKPFATLALPSRRYAIRMVDGSLWRCR